MAATWTDVRMIEEKSGFRNGRVTGFKRFYAESSTVVSTADGYTASHGGVTVPLPGEAFSGSLPTCVVDGMSIDHIDRSPFQLMIDVQYNDTAATAFEPDEDLLAKAAKIEVDDNYSLEEYVIDASDESTPFQVTNTAGEPYDRNPRRLTGFEVIMIEKYVDDTTRTALRAIRRTVNDANFTIKGVTYGSQRVVLAKAKFTDVRSGISLANLVLWAKDEGEFWIDSIPSYGFQELDAGDRVDITGSDGNPVFKAWPLDSTGAAMPNSTDDAYVFDFVPYFFGSFSPIPTS